MNTENKPVYFTKEQLKQHLEARGINTNEKARPIIDALAAKGAVIEGFNDQKQPNLAQSVLGGVVKPTMDLIGAGFAGVGALGNRLGQQGTEFVAGQLDNLINSTGGFDGEQTFSERAKGIQQPSSIGQAYANQSQQVRESAANPISQTITGQNIRPAENLKELGGDVLQTAALAVPGGVTLKGASTLAKIGGGAAYGTLGGGAFGAGQAMSNNETLEDILKSGAIGAGLGATLGAAIPAVPVAVNALRKTPEVANDVYSATKNLRSNLQSYVGSKTVEPQFGTAATRLTGSATRLESPLASYSKYLPQAEKAMADIKVDEPISLVGSQIGDKFKEVVSLRRDVGNTMGQELKTVGKLKTNIEPIFENFEKALFENGLTYNGLSKKIIANDLSKVAPDDIALIEDFVQELNRIGAKPSVAQIDALISRVTDKINYAKSAKGMTSTTNGERLVKGALNSLRSKFDEVPELAKYAEARKNYAELSNFIDEGASFLGNVTQSGDFAKDASLAKSAVQSILNNGKKDWLLKLEALTDYPALDESILALQAMKDAGNYKGLSLLETLSDGAIPTSKAGFTQKILDYVMEKGTRVVAGTPGERTKAYLKSLEMSGSKVPKTSIKTNTPTPKSGLTNIPSSKGIKKSNVDIKATIPQSTKAATKGSGKLISDEAVAKAREVLNKAGKPTEYRTLGITTEELQAAAVIGARHIEDGIRTAVELGERLAKEGIRLTKAQLDKVFLQAEILQKGARLNANVIDEANDFVNMFSGEKFSSPEMAKEAKKFLVNNDLDYKLSLTDKETFDVLKSIVNLRQDLRKTTYEKSVSSAIPRELQPSAEEDLYGKAIRAGTPERFIKKLLEPYEVTLPKDLNVYRGEGKGIGNTTLVKGKYFADSRKFAENFGEVTTAVIPKEAKILDLDFIKNIDQDIFPTEWTVNPDKMTKFLIDLGYTHTRNTNSRGVEYVSLSLKKPTNIRGNSTDFIQDINPDYRSRMAQQELESKYDVMELPLAKYWAEIKDKN